MLLQPRVQGKTIRNSRFSLKDRPFFVKTKDIPAKVDPGADDGCLTITDAKHALPLHRPPQPVTIFSFAAAVNRV
jgi:hypothetical protein